MNKNPIWTFDDSNFEKEFIGPRNVNLDIIATELDIEISHINNHLLVDENNPNAKYIISLLKILTFLHQEHISFISRDIVHIINALKQSENILFTEENIKSFYQKKKLVLNTSDGKKIICKTLMQKTYIDTLESSSITFVTGSAGTGKTYLAVAFAVNALKKNMIKRIVITRPAVEAGEKLGFLPGDLKEKVDPYLIPIYDALNDFLGKENVDRLVEKRVIEIAPLAYMRGRTLDDAIIILDEAQNTTSSQMKMFLTRLGYNSKMIITGDESQIDLNRGEKSGLMQATYILKNIKGISVVAFTKYDVMRHPLVSKVIERYEGINND